MSVGVTSISLSADGSQLSADTNTFLMGSYLSFLLPVDRPEAVLSMSFIISSCLSERAIIRYSMLVGLPCQEEVCYITTSLAMAFERLQPQLRLEDDHRQRILRGPVLRSKGTNLRPSGDRRRPAVHRMASAV